jgi:hypothetical protein
VSAPTRNLTGLSWFLDTHVHDHVDFKILRKLYETGWVYLQVPDTVVIELSDRNDPEHREILLDSISIFPIPMGPSVLGHSLLGLSVTGSDDDQKRLSTVHLCIWGNQTFASDAKAADEGNNSARKRLRDTMIVSTTIRYHSQGLITHDGKIIDAVEKVRVHYPDFRVLSIHEATSLAMREISRIRKTGIYKELPDWP